MVTKVPDNTITQQANQKLSNRGIRSPCTVRAQTTNGDVTLSGNVQFGHQKSAAAQVVAGIAGVRRVIDQLIVKPAAKRQ